MPLFTRRSLTPKIERRKSKTDNFGSTPSSVPQPINTTSNNRVLKTTSQRKLSQRSLSPFRFRWKEKQLLVNEEADSETTSSAFHQIQHLQQQRWRQNEQQQQNEQLQQQQQKSEEKVKIKKSPLGALFPRKQQNHENDSLEKTFDLKPRKRQIIKTSSSKQFASSSSPPLPLPQSSSSLNATKPSIFITSPAARTTPKGKKNRKTNVGVENAFIKSTSSRTLDSMQSSLTSSSLLQYPPSKLSPYKRHSFRSPLPLTHADDNYIKNIVLSSRTIKFEDDNGIDNDNETETKSVDTQQYAEYQNVLHQLKAKILKDKNDHERRQKEFDLMNEMNEENNDDYDDGNDDDENIYEPNNASSHHNHHHNYITNNDSSKQSPIAPWQYQPKMHTRTKSPDNIREENTRSSLQDSQLLHQEVVLLQQQLDNNDVELSEKPDAPLFCNIKSNDINSSSIQSDHSNSVVNDQSRTRLINTLTYPPPATSSKSNTTNNNSLPVSVKHSKVPGEEAEGHSIKLDNSIAPSRNTRSSLKKSDSPPPEQSKPTPTLRQRQAYSTPPLSPSPSFKSSKSMSASLRRKARFAASQNTNNNESQPPQQERRRNFAFMRASSSSSSSSFSSSPRRRRISTSTLEKTRAHSKKLAKLATAASRKNKIDDDAAAAADDDDNHFGTNFGEEDNNFNTQFFDHTLLSNNNNGKYGNHHQFSIHQEIASASAPVRSMTPPMKPEPTKLNFAAFETDSCMSANTSVYDMDYIDQMPSFDDTASSTSFFSSASNFSAGSYIHSNYHMKQIPVHYHQNHHHQQNWGKSKNKLDLYSGVGNNNQQQNYLDCNNNYQNNNMIRSSMSTVSNGSSISGAAARRLIRRGLTQQMSKGSANSVQLDYDVSISQNSALETPPKTNEYHQQQLSTKSKSASRNDERPPLSPVPFLHDGISAKSSRNSSYKKKSSSSNSKTGSGSKKKIHIESTGFTFDAFGLDANEIDNEVNEAMKELADSNLDLSLFALGSNGEDNYSTSSGSSSIAGRMNQQVQQHQRKEMIDQLNNQLTSLSSSVSFKRGVASSKISNGAGSTDMVVANESGIKALREKFKTTHLPDISTDNISIEATNDHGDFNLSSVVALSDEFKSKSGNDDNGDKLNNASFNKNDDNRGENKVYQWKDDSENIQGFDEDEHYLQTSESITSSDSGEVQQFQARKPAGNFQPQSESQRRAKEWASQRTTPILVSPLLVPKKVTAGKENKEKQTVSHKRAKEWASEAPRTPYIQNNFSPKLENRKQFRSISPIRRNSVSNPWSDAPPSPQPSSDEPVKGNYKSQKSIRSNPRSPINKEVLSQVANVALRQTNSFVDNGKVDYEKFKSSAPSVPLKKVAISTRPNKTPPESNSFLSTVKLRKTNSPSLQIDTIPNNNVQDNEDEPEYDDSNQFDESDNSHLMEQVQLESLVQDQRNDALSMPKKKLSYREQRELQLREEEAKRQSQTILEQKPPDVQAIIRKRIAANKQNLMKNNAACAQQKNEEFDISSLRNKLRPPSPREAEVLKPTKETNSLIELDHQKSLLRQKPQSLSQKISAYSKAQIIPDPSDEPGTDMMNEEPSESMSKLQENSSVVDLVTKRSAISKSNNNNNNNNNQDEPEDPEERNDEEYDSSSPSINNVSALFAARAKALQPTHVSEDEQKDEVEDAEVEQNDEPSINNIAALFQKRSQMMAGSSKPMKKMKEKKDITPDGLNESFDPLAEGSNSKLLDLFATKSGSKHTQGARDENDMILVGDAVAVENEPSKSSMNPALKDDPEYAKYFKMLKMGLPMQAVKHAMTCDGVDANLMDGDHSKPVDSAESSLPLKEDPKYSKYFKMLKMGLPMGAVKNAMERDGENPSIMDGDHNLPALSDSQQKGSKASRSQPKDKYRRTRLHWDTLRQVRSTSVWAQINQDPDVEQIEIDENEFAELFQSELGSRDVSKDTDTGKKRNAVKVIDPKRANNGGIILARLKITYEEMAHAIDRIDETVMSLEQMQGIVEYIPKKEEKIALRKYMTSSDKDSADAFDELCECEKFMVAMMTVKHSKEKVRAILFKQQFKQCMDELGQDVMLVERSCDELRNSVRLRKLLGIVLNIGNRLNTAGPTRKGKAGAFTIESLLKLSQAKAFDKKTTFLHYIVMVVKRNNDSLIKFKNDIPSVLKSDKIYWDQCESDLEEVENQLENVRKIALHEVYGKSRPSWARRNKGKDDDDMSQESMSLEAEVQALRSTNIGLFTLHAIKIVSSLREHVEKTKVKFFKLLEYFGEEDKKKMNPHELFEIMVSFSRDFDAAVEEVAKIEKQKKKLSQRKNSTRTQSPSSRSKDSSARDEEISTQSDPSPKISQQQTHTKPLNPLRISSHQPHVVSKPREVSLVKPKPQVSNTTKESNPNVLEHMMEESEQINPGSPLQQFSHDTESRVTGEVACEKIFTNKSMVTSETISSDSESQEHHLNKAESDSSKEGCDENAAPSNFSHQVHNDTSNNVAWTTKQPQSQPIHVSFGENINATSNDQNNQLLNQTGGTLGINQVDVPTSVSTHSIHPDNQSTRKQLDRQSMREKARAMRHQRMMSHRTSSFIHHSPMKSGSRVNSASNTTSPDQHRALPSEYRRNTKSPSPEKNYRHADSHSTQLPQHLRRRQPPSPEGLRPAQSSQSTTQLASSTSLASAQQRIRARRERIERRRRIDT